MRFLNLFFFLFIVFVSSTNASSNFHDNENNILITDCDFSYVVDDANFSVSITTVNAPHTKVKLLDESWDPIYTCTDNCSNPVVVNNLSPGEYVITIMYFDDGWNNTCTTNEKFELTGGPCTDNDGDGLCAFEDCNDYDATLPQPAGTSCNDYDGTTINDQIQSDGCTCLGTPYQGPCNINYSLNSDAGSIEITGLIAHAAKVRIYNPQDWSTVYSCDADCGNEMMALGIPTGYYNIDVVLYDVDFNTICTLNEYFNWDSSTCTDNDQDGICVSADCDDNNPSLPGNPGAACDDRNSATINDMIGETGCTCEGEVYEGLCNISYLVGSNKLSITGLVAEHVKVRVYDSNWNRVFQCFDNCDQEQEVTGLNPNEEYYLKVRLMDEEWSTMCSMEEYFVVQAGNSCADSDADGYCDDIDCDSNDPAWPKTPGTSCDDGDNLTVNDVIQSDGCSCAGEEEDNSDPCSSVYAVDTDGTLYIGGFPAGYYANVKVYVGSNIIFECTATCEDPTKLAELPTGDYLVVVKILDQNWELACYFEQTITMFTLIPEGMVTQNEWATESESAAVTDATTAVTIGTANERSEDTDKLVAEPTALLFPNPVTTDLNIKIDAFANKQSILEVYNQLGQVVARKDVASWPESALVLNCADLNPGVYFLVVRTADGLVVGEQFVR